MLFEDDSESRAGACSENNFSASLLKPLRFAQNDGRQNIMFARTIHLIL